MQSFDISVGVSLARLVKNNRVTAFLDVMVPIFVVILKTIITDVRQHVARLHSVKLVTADISLLAFSAYAI